MDTSENIAYATFDNAEHARVAVKLLTNQGFDAEQLYVLCTDEKRREAFRSRLMPAGATQLNTAPTVVGTAGAAIGAGVLGAAGLATGGVAAAAGAAVGAATGAGLGALLGAGTCSDDTANRLAEHYAEALEQGLIVVHVQLADDPSEHAKATECLETARNGIV